MRRRGAAPERSVGRRNKGRAESWGRKGGVNEQPGSLSQAPVKTRRAGACVQAACSLPLAPVSCRRSLSVEATPPLQLACRTLGLENTPLPQALCPAISPYGTLVKGRHPIYLTVPGSVTPIGRGNCRGNPCPVSDLYLQAFLVFPDLQAQLPARLLRFSGAVIGCCACGTLPASAHIVADWVESCPERSLNPNR